MASKILVTGSLNGHLRSTFEKISKLHAKNSFSFALIVGDLFADPAQSSEDDQNSVQSLLEGEIEIPLTTYFTVGNHALPLKIIERLESNNDEVVSNLYYLGKRSTTKTSEGIRIVSLGGCLDDKSIIGLSKDKYPPFHSETDAKSLHGANSADILLTTNWPLSIRKGSNIQIDKDTAEPKAEQCIADLCAKLRPRYHFSASSDLFYEREPFAHAPTEPGSTSQTITRFISLAAVNSATKQKSLYAFNLDPNAPQPHPVPQGTTPSPLISTSTKRPNADNNQYSRYGSGSGSHNRPSKRRNRQARAGPEECFFCLSNPELSTHLITSIATDTYVTTARGPLTSASTFPGLNFPTHMLLIPLSHSSTMTTIPDPDSRATTYKELMRYRSALHNMIATKGDRQLAVVTWEVSRTFLRHFHWQLLPVQRSLAERDLVEAAFRVEAENEKYPGFQKRDIGDGTGEGEYFRVWIWTPGRAEENGTSSDNKTQEENDDSATETGSKGGASGKDVQLVLPLGPEMKFDIQFGRRVMAKLLGLDRRVDWKDCVQSEDEEKQDAEAFKEAFKEWDFALDED